MRITYFEQISCYQFNSSIIYFSAATTAILNNSVVKLVSRSLPKVAA
jgi:hypothetical protein